MRKEGNEMLEERYGAVMAMLAERHAASEAERLATLAARGRRERAIAQRAQAMAARIVDAPRTIVASIGATDRTNGRSAGTTEPRAECPTAGRAA